MLPIMAHSPCQPGCGILLTRAMPPAMHKTDRIRLSKFLSLVLRHRPQRIGIELTMHGWVKIDRLVEASGERGRAFTREQLAVVVAECEKQRFALSPCKTMIRASQGHSVAIDLGYEPTEPPNLLYHGTAETRVGGIRREGLRRMKRHHVHLSEGIETAERVGARHGKPIVLTVRAGEMHKNGHHFAVSANRVWLTEAVPPEFLDEAP